MEEYIEKSTEILNELSNWIANMTYPQLLSLCVCIVAVVAAMKVASKLLNIILKILSILAAIYFVAPDLFAKIIAYIANFFPEGIIPG